MKKLKISKKANISINVIIAIALILIVLFLLMWKVKDIFVSVDQAYSCGQQGGRCVSEECPGTIANYDCPEGEICCMDIG
ncbi:hypothetical protein GF323_01265 [Candidatus Woesearchaeota archaeon]|nr:hypothetical protein [Candidatus Woesearchaeota archaeon]